MNHTYWSRVQVRTVVGEREDLKGINTVGPFCRAVRVCLALGGRKKEENKTEWSVNVMSFSDFLKFVMDKQGFF